MIFRVLASDLLKIKRKWIWFLIFLGPFGVIGLETINFTLRYDYLTKMYKKDLWGGLIDNVRFLSYPTLAIGITLITSMIANIEHHTNSWKQLLALPISKAKVFTSKFILTILLLLISCTLLVIGTIGLGLGLKYGMDIPVLHLIKMVYFPFLATMPIIALQIWLSITMKNQAIPLTIGILGTVVTLYAIALPDWVPYKWITLENNWGGPMYSVLAGLIVGAIFYVIGLIDFVRKDVL